MRTKLSDVGYGVSGTEVLSLETGKKYSYENGYDQREYERISNAAACDIEDTLTKEMGLKRVLFPVGRLNVEPAVDVFASDGTDSIENLLVIVPGTNSRTPGAWSMRHALEKNWEEGIVLEYVRRAFAQKMEVLLVHPYGKDVAKSNESLEDHLVHVWDRFISCTGVRQVAFICHENACLSMMTLLRMRGDSLMVVTKAIVFFQSLHMRSVKLLDSLVSAWLEHVLREYRVSNKPLDEPLERRQLGVPLSGGCEEVDRLPSSTVKSVFPYLTETLNISVSETVCDSAEERLRSAEREKAKGNEYVKKKMWRRAIGCYRHVFLYLDGISLGKFSNTKSWIGNKCRGEEVKYLAKMFNKKLPVPEVNSEELLDEINTLRLATYSNLSLCFLQVEMPEKCVECCDHVLEKDRCHVKALSRRGAAALLLGDLLVARNDLEQALHLLPNDPGVKQQLKLLREKEKAMKKSNQS